MRLLFTFSRPPVALSAATISKMPLKPTRASKAAAAYVTVTISALREVSEAMQFVLAAYAGFRAVSLVASLKLLQ
jgi:hypothetical protein